MIKFSEKLTVILFCLIIASLTAAFLILPSREFSEQENRDLAQSPELTGESFFSGKFSEDINLYFADQFPLRDSFVKLKSATELALLKGENNGVLISYDQLAVKNFDSYESRVSITKDTDRLYENTIRAQFDALSRLSDKVDIPIVTVIPPRTVDIVDSAFGYDRPDGDMPFELAEEILTDSVGYIDVLTPLRSGYEAGEYVYYRTDHHWTTSGAYIAYEQIMKKLGHEGGIVPKDEFEIETVEGFSGTTASKANPIFYRRDELEIWHLPDDGEYSVTVDGVSLGGFYNRDFLEKNDKYSVFLDGTHNVTKIEKSGCDRPTLLIAKDSFANCLIPFLAREFDIVAVNLRTNVAVSTLVTAFEADALLIVYNAENIVTSADIGNLR